MIFAAIAAGGSGSRMGADIPKQFLELGGRPVIIRTVEKFLGCSEIDMVFVGVNCERVEYMHSLIMKYGLDSRRITVVKGGRNRDHTIGLMIESIQKLFDTHEDDIIITHDGARPFVSKREIRDSIRGAEAYGGVTLCLPSTDTLLLSHSGEAIESVPDRKTLFRAQTPQTFKLHRLIDAYHSLSAEQCLSITDTASVFTLAGLKVRLIEGSDRNIKLTTPTDMKIALLFAREEDLEENE